jgi:hypothetical protein
MRMAPYRAVGQLKTMRVLKEDRDGTTIAQTSHLVMDGVTTIRTITTHLVGAAMVGVKITRTQRAALTTITLPVGEVMMEITISQTVGALEAMKAQMTTSRMTSPGETTQTISPTTIRPREITQTIIRALTITATIAKMKMLGVSPKLQLLGVICLPLRVPKAMETITITTMALVAPGVLEMATSRIISPGLTIRTTSPTTMRTAPGQVRATLVVEVITTTMRMTAGAPVEMEQLRTIPSVVGKSNHPLRLQYSGTIHDASSIINRCEVCRHVIGSLRGIRYSPAK